MEKQTKPCPYCGEQIMADAKKCRHCGEWLEGNKPQNNSKKANRSNAMWICVSIVALIAIIAIIVLQFRNNGNNLTETVPVDKPSVFSKKEYVVDTVSFDPKSFLALNLLNREQAIDKLKLSGWEHIAEIKVEGCGKIADLFSMGENKVEVLIQNPLYDPNNFGPISFKTQSKEIKENWCKDIESLGFKPNKDHANTEEYTTSDSIKIKLYEDVESVDTTYTMFVFNLPFDYTHYE